MSFQTSNFSSMIREICEEEGIALSVYSGDWALRLSRDGRIFFIVGYNFPLNAASAKELCQDKALTGELLSSSGIPAVPHLFVPVTVKEGSREEEAVDSRIRTWLSEYGEVVVKDNYGTGGNYVFRASDFEEAKKLIEGIHKRSFASSVSPFLQITQEYRVTMLDGEPELFIRKERPFEVLENGERRLLNWKHNLGQGAVGIVVTDSGVRERLFPMAKKAAEILDIRFASVDIVEVSGEYRVLEVNAGVMMEHFSGQSAECRMLAKEIYRKAILKAFGSER